MSTFYNFRQFFVLLPKVIIFPKKMSDRTLYIREIRKAFSTKEPFGLEALAQFYRHYQSGVSQNTVKARARQLVKKGVICRIGRGIYILGEQRTFIPPADTALQNVAASLSAQFPDLKICLWRTSWLAPFMLHQPARHFSLIEVESDSEQRSLYSETVFHYLQEHYTQVYHQPDAEIMENYAAGHKDSLIVLPLVSEAPLQPYYSVTSVTLEKMLGDIFCNATIFSAQQGSEKDYIFREAFRQYTVNQDTLIRYATRRNKGKAIKDYLNDLNIGTI